MVMMMMKDKKILLDSDCITMGLSRGMVIRILVVSCMEWEYGMCICVNTFVD